MRSIIFDKLSSQYFDVDDLGCNSYILKNSVGWLEELFRCYGYLYLNKVYEVLGIDWNPDDENICYRKENGPLKITYEAEDAERYIVYITQ